MMKLWLKKPPQNCCVLCRVAWKMSPHSNIPSVANMSILWEPSVDNKWWSAIKNLLVIFLNANICILSYWTWKWRHDFKKASTHGDAQMQIHSTFGTYNMAANSNYFMGNDNGKFGMWNMIRDHSHTMSRNGRWAAKHQWCEVGK